MKRKYVLLSLMVGVFLGTVGAVISTGVSVTAAQAQSGSGAFGRLPQSPISVASSQSDILALMFEGYKKWDTLHAVAIFRTQDPSGGSPIQSDKEEVWLNSDGRSRLDVSSSGGLPVLSWANDGTHIVEENLQARQYYSMEVPRAFSDPVAYDPRAWFDPTLDTIYLNQPFALMDSPIKDWLVPSGLAQAITLDLQRPGSSLDVIGTEEVAGRGAIVVLRSPRGHKLWVDMNTGVILKAQYLDSAAKDVQGADWSMDFEIIEIEFDHSIGTSQYSLSPAAEFEAVTPFKLHEGAEAVEGPGGQ